jgi:hypothetical protein
MSQYPFLLSGAVGLSNAPTTDALSKLLSIFHKRVHAVERFAAFGALV